MHIDSAQSAARTADFDLLKAAYLVTVMLMGLSVAGVILT